jgi:hypothetical protein
MTHLVATTVGAVLRAHGRGETVHPDAQRVGLGGNAMPLPYEALRPNDGLRATTVNGSDL